MQRKLLREEYPERDPRVDEFLTKIGVEVQRTDEVMDAWSARVQAARALSLGPTQVTSAVRLAIECLRVPAEISLALAPAAETLLVDGDLQTLAVGCPLPARKRERSQRLRLGQRGARGRSLRRDRRRPRDRHWRSQTVAERFETTKPGHLGLGLWVARRIATRSGGELTISRPERGTEVRLRIPLSGSRSTEDGV